MARIRCSWRNARVPNARMTAVSIVIPGWVARLVPASASRNSTLPTAMTPS
jgi:hypothetical protein